MEKNEKRSLEQRRKKDNYAIFDYVCCSNGNQCHLKCVLSEDHEARDQGWFRYEMVFTGFGVAKLCTAILF